MKKGISLIVLVITIIVMIIIAGAIIISLNSSNVISQANTAVESSDIANIKSALALDYADIMAVNNDKDASNDYTADTARAKYQATVAATKVSGVSVALKSDTDFRPVLTVTAKDGTTTQY